MKPDPLTITIREACALSGLSRSTIYRLIVDGRLHTVKVMGCRLITYASLRGLLKAA